MDNLLKFFNKVDWLLAIACFIFGFYTGNHWYFLAGLLSVFMAWYKPAERIKKTLEKKLLRKKSTVSDNHVIEDEDAFYARHDEGHIPSPDTFPTKEGTAPHFGQTLIRPGSVYLHTSKHNMLQRQNIGVSTKPVTDDTWV